MRYPALIAAALAALGLAACAGGPVGGSHYRSSYEDPGPYVEFGRVVAIETAAAPAPTSGAGAVVGGVLGGVLGHQFGGGRGKDAATAAGAIGGAIVGNEMERSRNTEYEWRITVRLDRGGTRTIVQDSSGEARVGDRVRIENGRVFRG